MADRIPVKAKYAAGSPVDVIALQEFEPTDTIPLSIISGFSAGVTAELALNSISTLSDVSMVGSPAPVNGEVLTWNSTSGMWENKPPTGGGGVWGTITGTLSDQLDLQSALDLKTDVTVFDAHTGDATIHFTTLVGLADVSYTGSPALINGQVLTWNNANNYWEPSPPAPGVTDHDLLTNNGGVGSHAVISTHIADNAIHFTQANISITESQISDLQTYELALGNPTVNGDMLVSTSAGVRSWATPVVGITDHTFLTSIGTNTHAQIDTHIADGTIHYTDAPNDSQDYVRNNNTWTVATSATFGAYIGVFDASTGTFPTTSNQGDWFNVTVAGTVDGQVFIIGDILVALVNSPSTITFAGNWTVVPNVSVTDHTMLTNIGTNTHAQIDTGLIDSTNHISDPTIHFTQSSISITESQISDFGTYEPAFAKNTGFNLDLGTIASTVTEGNDPRLSDARTPTAHTHLESDITDLQDYELNLGNPVADGDVLSSTILGVRSWITPKAHAAIDTHIAGTALQHPAIDVTYNNTTSGLPSINVQEGIDDLYTITRFKNSTHSGIIAGGMMASTGNTTISITDGNGAIVNQISNPSNPTGELVSWSGLTATITMEPSGFGSTHIFVTQTGVVAQFTSKPTTQTYTSNMYLGIVYYEANVITLVANAPIVLDSTAVNLLDYIDFADSDIHGVSPLSIGIGNPASILEFYITGGEIFRVGVNWHTDRYNPNIFTMSASGTDSDGSLGSIPWNAGAIFDYILGDGTIFQAGANVINPDIYDNGGSNPGNLPNGDNNGCIQFIVRIVGGKNYIQPHTKFYRDFDTATNSVQEAFSEFILADAINDGTVIGAFVGEEETYDWERGDRATIKAFGAPQGGSGSGGGTVVDWGTIQGTLSAQGDLQSALDLKADKSIFDAHIAGNSPQHSAADILFDDTSVGGGFTEVQSTIDFLDEQIGLRETAATGVIEGGFVTIASPTTIDITSGAGEIVDGYTDRRNPTRTNVSWVASLGFVINMPAQAGVQVIYVDGTGTIMEQPTSMTPTQRRNLVQIAFVNYSAGVITSVSQAGILSNEVGNTLFDWIYFTNTDDRVNGMGIKPVTNAMSIWGDTGKLFSPGININVDTTNQNIKTFIADGDANTPAVFDVVFADGTIQAAAQTIVPAYYESAPGVIFNLAGNDATIHYVYRTIANKTLLQLGTSQYGNAQQARDQLQLDRTNYVAFIGSGTALLSAQIYVEGNAPDFNDPNDAGIVSTIGASGVSSGVQISNYLDLTDVVDSSYAGQVGKVPMVNVSETGLEFTTISTTDEMIKVSATDTTAGYLGDELVAGSNITLTVLNPGADEKLEVKYDKSGMPYIATIGGNDMVVFDDTTRANKTLSSESQVLYFAESVVADNDWMQVQHATDADSGYVMPFNGTIVSVAMHCENTNGVAKIIDLYINGTTNSSIGAFIGNVNENFTDTAFNTDFVAGDKIRLRGGASGGQIQDTNIQLRVKWRL